MFIGAVAVFLGFAFAGVKEDKLSLFSIFVGVLLIGYSVYCSYGPLDVLDEDVSYIVKARVSDTSGETLILYDLSSKRNRLAELKQYPPPGFKELKTMDGQNMLSSTTKK